MLKYNLITKIGIHLKKRIKEVNAGIKKENNLPFQNILILNGNKNPVNGNKTKYQIYRKQ